MIGPYEIELIARSYRSERRRVARSVRPGRFRN